MASLRSTVSEATQRRVRTFFEVYDPERLQSSDFNILIRYIAKKGLHALEDKLMEKYGVNISSMEDDNNLSVPEESSNRLTETHMTNRTRYGPEELETLPQPVVSPPVISSTPKAKYESITLSAGVNPSNGQKEDTERTKMFHRLTEFYKEHNKQKIKDGIGKVVDYALKYGEGRINEKLRLAYGEDLPMFEARKVHMHRQTVEAKQHDMLQEEQNILKSDPERQKLRQDLIDFFLIVEPERAELRMDPLLNYADKQGIDRLNGKLFKKYGYDLTNVPSTQRFDGLQVAQFSTVKPRAPSRSLDPDLDTMAKGDLPEYVLVMLTKYYSKFDQMMLEDGGVEKVYEWTRRNGIKRLNRSLKERYGESFQDFVREANSLRDDLIEFYRHRDKNKLVTGIQAILDWGLRNGRQALNEKLTAKYGIGLDPAKELYADVMESASTFC